MKRQIVVAIGLGLLTSLVGAAASPLTSGLDPANMDKSVRAQDNFYEHINGHWLAITPIPADKPGYGAFDALYDKSIENLRSIIEDAQKAPHNDGERKVGDLYASFMDEAHLEALGAKPLESELARIDAIKNTTDVAAQIAHNGVIGVDAPFGGNVHLDNKDSTKYEVDFGQSGLGLPDRDYYLKDEDAKLKGIRDQYVGHVERMLKLGGDADAKADAASVLALETALAKIQWTKVEERDPIKAYNKVQIADLDSMAPGFDWKTLLTDSHVADKVDYVNISQPSYFKGMAELIKSTPIPTWKIYFRWQLLHASAPYLSKAFVDENFAFYGTALRGTPENRARWKRGVRVVEASMGEQLGQVYVSRYFSADSKARVTQLVQNLLAAYRQSIGTLDWMGPDTKQQALAKLSQYMLKLGYPDKWRDYSALQIDRNDLLGNVRRANEFEFNRNINKLGKPIDRTEWGMTPQTVNA
ncbi:MAG TPA: M13 family peptidase, partial [Xanthomonadaceae bacterium]|nr:M13 family peptidase [Xanthomonadaceae bacterium]